MKLVLGLLSMLLFGYRLPAATTFTTICTVGDGGLMSGGQVDGVSWSAGPPLLPYGTALATITVNELTSVLTGTVLFNSFTLRAGNSVRQQG